MKYFSEENIQLVLGYVKKNLKEYNIVMTSEEIESLLTVEHELHRTFAKYNRNIYSEDYKSMTIETIENITNKIIQDEIMKVKYRRRKLKSRKYRKDNFQIITTRGNELTREF